LATLGFTEIRENAKDLISLSADDMNDLQTVTEVLRPLKTITVIMCDKNKSRSEPGNAPRIGIGHREVVCQK